MAYLRFFVPEKCLSYIYLHVLSSLPSRANFEGDISVTSQKDILFISVDLLRGDIYENTVNVYTPKIFPFQHLQGRTGTVAHPGEICWGMYGKQKSKQNVSNRDVGKSCSLQHVSFLIILH